MRYILDNREEPRADIHQTVKYATGEYAGESALSGVTVNLSRSGICLIAFHQLKRGQQIKIESGLSLADPATVCWVKKLDKDLFKAGLVIIPQSLRTTPFHGKGHP